ncbi:MAG: ribonuclease III [Defluviitaleaceae bacterium]|nr:ribonuclease III [Defluviitaleaceae bacterium]
MAFNQLLNHTDPAQLSPLNLAFVGDAVYSLLVRTRLVTDANRPAHALNKRSSERVCATRQSADYYRLLPHLTDAETAVMKRGRNANPASKAKNATTAEYRNATGLECLFGYLYLKSDEARILELFNICWSDDENETKS